MAITTSDADLIKGQDLLIFIGADPIGYATTCSLEMTMDTIDTSNKMSGAYKTYLVGQMGWTLSSDSMLTFATTAGQSIADLFEAMEARTPVTVKFAKVGAAYAAGVPSFTGSALITSLSVQADNGAVATMSVTMTGTGALTKAEV